MLDAKQERTANSSLGLRCTTSCSSPLRPSFDFGLMTLGLSLPVINWLTKLPLAIGLESFGLSRLREDVGLGPNDACFALHLGLTSIAAKCDTSLSADASLRSELELGDAERREDMTASTPG